MRFAYAGVALFVAAAAYAGTFSSEPELDSTLTGSIQKQSYGNNSGVERFTLQVEGMDSGCKVRTETGASKLRQLSLSPVCAVQVPALASAKLWLDRGDGSVAFAQLDGSIIAEFAVADGVALETYAPHQPIMTLLAN